MPEIGRRQGERGHRPHRPDLGARHVRRRVSAEGGRARQASSTYGFADEALRPPGSIGNQPRWPVQPQSNYQQGQNYPASSYPQRSNYPESAVRQPSGYGASSGPMSLNAPGVAPQEDEIDLPPEGTDAAGAARYMNAPSYPVRSAAPYSQAPAQQPLPRLGPAQGNPVAAVGPVTIKPTATLACPIVSELDRWLADTVQPSAMRWFGARVAEIKQISAYSCRGMNGNPHSHISEHAFGNALDISAFVLADGRRVTVKDGWRGMPEEQGFLRDVQSGACAHFTTVLAPGSNVYHYDHIHVDLMRRASRRLICQPAAVSGEEVAGRAQRRNPYANSKDPYITGSLGASKSTTRKREEDEYADD